MFRGNKILTGTGETQKVYFINLSDNIYTN